MKKYTLLLIDDEPYIIELIHELLDNKIEKILTASNGKEGLDLIIKNPQISCVICDIRMPIMDGLETIKAVRDRNNNVPFIFYTGHGDDGLMLEAAKYGAFEFLNKPKLDNLESAVLNGLKYGFDLKNKENSSEASLMSEYQLLLLNLSKNNDE